MAANLLPKVAAVNTINPPATHHPSNTKTMKKFPLPLILIVYVLRGTLFLGAGLMFVQPRASASGVFEITGTLDTARDRQTATLLPDGLVLVAGGLDNAG